MSLLHLDHLIFPYALASVILQHNHTEYQLGKEMIVENLAEGDEIQTGILAIWSVHAWSFWILSELWKLHYWTTHALQQHEMLMSLWCAYLSPESH